MIMRKISYLIAATVLAGACGRIDRLPEVERPQIQQTAYNEALTPIENFYKTPTPQIIINHQIPASEDPISPDAHFGILAKRYLENPKEIQTSYGKLTATTSKVWEFELKLENGNETLLGRTREKGGWIQFMRERRFDQDEKTRTGYDFQRDVYNLHQFATPVLLMCYSYSGLFPENRPKLPEGLMTDAILQGPNMSPECGKNFNDAERTFLDALKEVR